MSGPIKLGAWPAHCQQRAFVEGARWMMMQLEGRTMWRSDRLCAEQEAIRIYGDPTDSPARPITARQLAVLQFIRDSIDKRGGQPTIREIGSRFLIQSPNGVASHIRSLLEKGLIEKSGRGIITLTSAGIAATERGDS